MEANRKELWLKKQKACLESGRCHLNRYVGRDVCSLLEMESCATFGGETVQPVERYYHECCEELCTELEEKNA